MLLRERHILAEGAFAELVVWRLSDRPEGARHSYKYRLAFVVSGRCVVRYDNERGKGDHRHADGKEEPYEFSTAEALLECFWRDVDEWRQRHG